MLSLLSSSVSSAWWIRELVVSLVAASGGCVVFWGLWLERDEEKEVFRDIHEFRSSKQRAKRGRTILLWGIAVEILVGFFIAAYDGLEIRQANINEARNNPLNQPIAALSANVFFEEQGTGRQNVDPIVIGFTTLTIGSSEQTNFWRPDMPWSLKCLSYKTSLLINDNHTNTFWHLDFNEDPMLPSILNGTVKDAAKWDTIKFQAGFLPRNTTIVRGKVILTVNSTSREFIIPTQKIKIPADLDGFTKNPPKSVVLFTF